MQPRAAKRGRQSRNHRFQGKRPITRQTEAVCHPLQVTFPAFLAPVFDGPCSGSRLPLQTPCVQRLQRPGHLSGARLGGPAHVTAGRLPLLWSRRAASVRSGHGGASLHDRSSHSFRCGAGRHSQMQVCPSKLQVVTCRMGAPEDEPWVLSVQATRREPCCTTSWRTACTPSPPTSSLR